ncbi:MAG: hypothetical protein JWQ14_326 [Adhaeribacter sp.]|nr:hypothetical protein [Adhaeribacter sp.]
MNNKDYLVKAANNNKDYNIRLCEIVATGSETDKFDKLFIIYKTPEGEFLKRVKHFHPVVGAPEITYEVITNKEVISYQNQHFT